MRFRTQENADKTAVFVDSDFDDDPVSRMSTTGLEAQVGEHTVKSGSTLHCWTPLCVREAEFHAQVKQESRWTILEIQKLGSVN